MYPQSLLPTLVSLALVLHFAATTPSTITTPPRPLLPRQTSSAFDANVAACSSHSSLASSCGAATSSFAQLPFSIEASCLCYTAVSTFAPSIYDGYWGSCLNYYQTASPEYYSQSLSGDALPRTPCAAAGNVMGASAATGVVSVVVTTSTSALSGSASASSTAKSSSSSAGSMERGGGTLLLAFLVALFAVL